MIWFKCTIRGENFRGVLIGEKRPVGFYTTRFIEANTPSEAKQLVLEKLKKDECLTLLKCRIKSKDAEVYFEKIEEVSEKDIGSSGGFTFFVMGT